MNQDTTLSRILPQFLIDRQGKNVALYAGLLDLAHREGGLKAIRTRLLQAPAEANNWTAICWAEVTVERGVFTGIGDANPANVGRTIAAHLIRMSETRAKARALRDALNIGGVALEELGEDDDTGEATPRQQQPRPLQQRQATAQQQRDAAGEDLPNSARPASLEQYDKLIKLRKALGLAGEVQAGLSAAAAANEIGSLVRQFNDQQKRARR